MSSIKISKIKCLRKGRAPGIEDPSGEIPKTQALPSCQFWFEDTENPGICVHLSEKRNRCLNVEAIKQHLHQVFLKLSPEQEAQEHLIQVLLKKLHQIKREFHNHPIMEEGLNTLNHNPTHEHNIIDRKVFWDLMEVLNALPPIKSVICPVFHPRNPSSPKCSLFL